MDFGLMLEPQIGMTYDEQLAAARWAEKAGLEVFARADHYLSSGEPPHATDALATLAGLARDTSSIGLCVLVSPISFRHPAVLLKNATTIDELSGGRFILGVGTGWSELEHDAFGIELWPMSERFARLEEALAYLRAALAAGAGGFKGKYYALDDIDVRPKATGALPIVIGGSGAKRTPRLAGTFADEYNLFVTEPEAIQARANVARAAAAEAGRDPDSILVSVIAPVITGRDQASYRANLETWASARGRTPEEHEARMREAGVPVGPAAEIREAVAAMAEAGVGRIYYQHFASPDIGVFEETVEALRG
jgi:alkanesulfonate monooxygenase SsuD/methylene tetrahydromethanopterin reductase-like flavin-dependent oxidoreductase (luciferase family)